ncbi:MAG: protein kinase domain-containing protein, partial [Anaerolineae bacterium]
EGKTLRGMIDQRQRLPMQQAVDITSQVADALEHAHRQGLVHRDIKPANVLIPNLDRPVVSDFGIARLLGETGLTSSGQLVGTPAYMSPEQGKGERGDARSDIYALGIVLYEMLTGRPPYDADTPYAIILKHINDPLVPPHVVIGPLPDAVERIVLKCLAKNPDDRFASMADLRHALRAAISGPPSSATREVSAPPTLAHAAQSAAPDTLVAKPAQVAASRLSQLPKWVPFTAGSVVLLGVLFILISALRGATPPVDAPQTTDNGSPVSEAQTLVDTGYEQLLGGDDGAALDLFNQALTLEPDNPNALVAWAVAELTRYGDAEAAGQYLDQAAPAIPDDPYLHYGYGLLYVRSETRQDPQASDAEVSRALETCGDNVPLCIEAYRLRSDVRFWYLGDTAGGIADMDSAIALSTDPNGTAYLHGERGDLRDSAGDPDGAIEDYVTAYELNGDGEYLQRAAVVAVQIEDYTQALTFYDRLLESFSGDPYYLVRRGYVEWQAGNLEGAADQARRALDLDSSRIEAHYVLGLALLDQGDPQAALSEFETFAAEDDEDRYYEIKHPFFIPDLGHDIAYDMARASHALGDLDGALALIDEALSRDDYWPEPFIERGRILTEQGDLEGARESYLKAREIADDDPELQASIDALLVELSK